jgi:CelD/BcsL family acetyltransferase involved in cellulose biosynthesis
MSTVEVLTGPEELRTLAPAWRDLALATDDASYFASPDWVLSWWETAGRGLDGRVAVWWDGGHGLTAVLPLGWGGHRLHPRLPLAVRCLTNLGGGPGSADHCGFAVATRATEEVRDWLDQMSQRRTLLLHDLDPSPAGRLVPRHARAVARSACPRITIPDDPARIGGSTKFRKQLRAYARRLDAAGVTFRWVPPGQVDLEMLDTLFGLHTQRSDVAGRTSAFGLRRGLHDRLVARARDGYGPAAVVAECDGAAVGMLYGFRWRDDFAYFQSGWRPDMAGLNLGSVLVAEAIRLAGDDGARVFDFLRGPEPYKYRFGAHDRVDLTYLIPRRVPGLLLRLKYAVRGPKPSGSAAADYAPVTG